jgi:ribosomal protein S6--L-glutamate ligase
MRLCFIVEEKYRLDGMPLDVARQLRAWDHDVDVLEPHHTLSAVSELAAQGRRYDAFVLKTVSGGPGLSLLAAASAVGHVAINQPEAIRMVRDKAVAAAVCRRYDIPFPLTYFASRRELLAQVPFEAYPLVVKPANGSSNENVQRFDTPAALAEADLGVLDGTFMLAQPYEDNPGHDLKVYCAGRQIFATVQPSPLHPEGVRQGSLVPLDESLRRLVTSVRRAFGLSVFGIDVVESPHGWVVLDVNDFPSFRLVPDAPAVVAETVLRLAADRGARWRGLRRWVPGHRPVPAVQAAVTR